MSDPHSDAAAVLAQFVPIGPEAPRAAALGAAVSDQAAARPPLTPSPDPEALTALRSLAKNPGRILDDDDGPDIVMSPLTVAVDVNALLEDHGETATWDILGKLKDLFGGPT